MFDALANSFPRLARQLAKADIATLPTPITEHALSAPGPSRPILVKHDESSAEIYGGNKVRKLEYLLQRALERRALRVATFGTVASNHALATAIYARQLGLACTCFLSHQTRTSQVPIALNMHLAQQSELVVFGGDRANRVQSLRKYVQHRRTWVIPMGGSCWLGVMGFVNAGLELAAQLEALRLYIPARLYVANGTMGTAVGLAIGLALAGLDTEVQAVRVTHEFVSNQRAMQGLLRKTVAMMRRLDPAVPADTETRTRLRLRDEFFAGGYARADATTLDAMQRAHSELGLTLDATYAGKAMAALLSDAQHPGCAEQGLLFWNTFNARPLPVTAQLPEDAGALPAEFLRYYDRSQL